MTGYESWLPVAAAMLLSGAFAAGDVALAQSEPPAGRVIVDGSILPFPPVPSASTPGLTM